MTIKNFSKDTILCDADFLIAFLLENDSNHIEAVEILNANIEADFVYLNLTEYELLTVLFSYHERVLHPRKLFYRLLENLQL